HDARPERVRGLGAAAHGPDRRVRARRADRARAPAARAAGAGSRGAAAGGAFAVGRTRDVTGGRAAPALVAVASFPFPLAETPAAMRTPALAERGVPVLGSDA